MELYLINYLRENARTPLARKYIGMLKVELDWFIYNYGEHISESHRRDKKISLKQKIYNLLVKYNTLYGSVKASDKNVLSSVGAHEFKSQLSDLGINQISSILQPAGYKQVIGDAVTLDLMHRKEVAIRNGVFNDLFNDSYFHQIETCRVRLLEHFKKYDFLGLFLYTDQYFESKLLLDICKELNIPSFDFLHGLPATYTSEVDNSTDYLMVWGQKIKQNYIDVGLDPNKIFVVGNTKYGNYTKSRLLRNSLESVLVIPVSSVLWHQHTWNTPSLVDRSMIILYLYKVQSVLEKLNVKHARFRPHPSINMDWVYGFLDQNFYLKDDRSLKDSLTNSSLVIGATSTVFFEALMYGVNYLVFEPQEQGISALRTKVVPPFNGKDEKVPVAFNEEDLFDMIISRCKVDFSILDDYMQPLDLAPVVKLLTK